MKYLLFIIQLNLELVTAILDDRNFYAISVVIV